MSILILFAIALLAVLGLAAAWAAMTYNGLVALRQSVRNAWSQIDVQLKRRYDLIPNLVETVKGYAGHEQDTLTRVVEARSKALGASGAAQQALAENELAGALSKLMLLVENYPDLKANQNFLALQEELTSTENKVSFSRQHYNDSVMIYNTRTETFPANLIAGMFSFGAEEFFRVDEPAEREAPQVSFS